MNSGGTIKIAQRIAGHTSPATTRIYDRSGDQLTLQEIESVDREETGDLNLAPEAFPRLGRRLCLLHPCNPFFKRFADASPYSMSFLTFRFKVPDALFDVRIN